MIGNLIRKVFFISSIASIFVAIGTANAALRVSVDRTEMSLEESLSLKISTTSTEDENFNPKFQSPDFEIINQFQSSQFSSIMVNGRFQNQSEQSITFILKPRKTGTLNISQIQNGKETAPNITVLVRNDPGMGQKKNLGGEAPKLSGDQRYFFVRAEVPKTKVYKGEQVVISFYFYRRTRADIRDVMKYPSFEGFIREDLEMPILSGRAEYEAVSLGGIPMERALIARYALYPIKEGKQRIDGFSVRADYIPRDAANDDLNEDPFFSFFTRINPRTATAKSDPLFIEVQPIPTSDRPSGFNGGVGEFNIETQIAEGPYQVGQPIQFRVLIRGKGNLNLIEAPDLSRILKNFKVYPPQSKTDASANGQGTKTFEYVIVPTASGAQRIPEIEIAYFHPENRNFALKKSSPLELDIKEGSLPQSIAGTDQDNPSTSTPSIEPQAPTGLSPLWKDLDRDRKGLSMLLGQPWWRWMAWFGVLFFFSFLGLVTYDQFRKQKLLKLEILKRKQSESQEWDRLETIAQSAYSDGLCFELSKKVRDCIDQHTGLRSNAYSVKELIRKLSENGKLSDADLTVLEEFLTEMDRRSFEEKNLNVKDDRSAPEKQHDVQIAKSLIGKIGS